MLDFASVAAANSTFAYGYLPNSNLIHTITGPAHSVTHTSEPGRDVLALKQNQVANSVVSEYGYSVNSIGQRSHVAQSGTALASARGIAWGYDALGQVTNADHDADHSFDRAYQYDAIGNTIVNTDAAGFFQYRFSTKPLDPTTGLYYYGYRWYDPLTGRWPSRDPIQEMGGINLYGFVGNDGVNAWDLLGLDGSCSTCPTDNFSCEDCSDQCKSCNTFSGAKNTCLSSCRNAKLSMNCNPDDDKGKGKGGGGVDCNKFPPTHPKCSAPQRLKECEQLGRGRNDSGRAKCDSCARKGGKLMPRFKCTQNTFSDQWDQEASPYSLGRLASTVIGAAGLGARIQSLNGINLFFLSAVATAAGGWTLGNNIHGAYSAADTVCCFEGREL